MLLGALLGAGVLFWLVGRGSNRSPRPVQRSIGATNTTNSSGSPTGLQPVPSSTSSVASSPSVAPAANPGLAGKVIAIDPGHNGGNYSHTAEISRLVPAGGFLKECDTTGTETDVGYTEAAYNFDLAMRLAADLRQQGVTVVMTRDSNDSWGPCVDQRAAIGNRAHANAAISIHADGGPSSGRGFHVIQPALVPGFTENILKPSHQLAVDVRASFLAGTGMPYSTYAGSQGLETRADLGGMNLSQVPKVFIETGNMRNGVDAALLTSPAFRQKAADALAAALITFVTR